MKQACCSACSASLRYRRLVRAWRCQTSRLSSRSPSAGTGWASTRRRPTSGRRRTGANTEAGQAEHEQQRADVGHQQVLGHVHAEELVAEVAEERR